MRVRIVTWNIHKGIGGVDRRYRLERTIELLSSLEADVVLLQEVAQGMPGLRSDDQLARLVEGLELKHHAFGAEHRFRVGGYGNAILSRFPLTDELRVDLTIGRRKQRGLIHARAHVKLEHGTRSLALFNVHLGLSGGERALQLQRTVACPSFSHLQQGTPLVLGGDLNDVWASLGARYLEPSGLKRACPIAATFPAALPLRPLDGLFVRGDIAVQSAHAVRTKLARAASDHLPILADLKLG